MTDDSDNLDGSRDVTLSAADAAAMDKILDHAASAAAPGLAVTDAATRWPRGWLKAAGLAAAPSAPGSRGSNAGASSNSERIEIATGSGGIDGRSEISSNSPIRRRQRSRRMAEIGAMAIAAMLLLAVVPHGRRTERQSKEHGSRAMKICKMVYRVCQLCRANSNGLPSLAMPADRNWLSSSDAAAAIRIARICCRW